MLYVFHVDTGTTYTFDIKLALASVSDLKEAIERECNVGVVEQVLLMSGGDSLESHARVCSYSAGTDTNPIYLFSKAAIESQLPPQPSLDYGYDVDLQTQVENSLALPATYQTLVTRAQLAKHCCGLARDQSRICERLVHDQHLQQQGWAAVVANLEDITQTFQARAEMLQQTFAVYLSERQEHMELLQNFSHDLSMLEKIPILPALREHADGFCEPVEPEQQQMLAIENAPTDNSGFVAAPQVMADDEHQNIPSGHLSLLKWISAKDNQSSLEQVADQCARGLDQFDERTLELLKNEINCAFEGANKQDMKEIKGLGERLFTLEQLMAQSKKLVHEQTELSHGFSQNRDRVSKLNDESVLPDLCLSHRRQLEVMLKNHNHLRDIRRRCTKAKEELSGNIHRRLKWIMYVENKMMEVDSKLVMYHESLRRLRRQLEILRQIHLAPQMYLKAVVEVVRRHAFSDAFLVWAKDTAYSLTSVYGEEIEKRRNFNSLFENHFLHALFPGFEDVPPPYATPAPGLFDHKLPQLHPEDIEYLKEQLPALADSLSAPDFNIIKQFFISKSITESSSDASKGKEISLMRIHEVPKESGTVRPPLINDRGGFESETDTEEFEKIGQAAMDSKLTSYESTKQQTPIRQKQMEVGAASISTSSTSTNVSPLNRSTSSSSELLQFPSLSTSEKKDQQPLSPLTECVEHTTPPSPKLTSNFPNTIATSSCDGQPKKLRRQSGSDGSSPSVGNGVGPNDFVGTEFYMDESLPSSLSEHPTDSQHQAIVSLLQENLSNSREEVERLRAVIRNMKTLAMDSLLELRRQLSAVKEQALVDRESVAKLIDEIGDAVAVHTRAIREREQEITVDHELELSDLKKTLQAKDDQIRNLDSALTDKESECLEQQRLIMTMRQKFDGEKLEMEKLQTVYRQIEERLEQSQADKETAIKQSNDARVVETNNLRTTLEQQEDRVRELEEKLASAEANYQKAIKDESDKLQLEYKAQYETMRSRFKLMHASTMERSPSDSSLEKIERADVLELTNHESIMTQTVETKRDECKRAIDENLKMSQTNSDLGESIKSEKSDDVKVSESKKVRLETDSDTLSLPTKLEILKADNKRLNSELKATRESKEEMVAKLKDLVNEKTRLEIELLKERVSKRTLSTDSMSTSSIVSSPEGNKDMNLSVAVVGTSSSRVDAATCTERSRREGSSSHSVRDKLTKSTTNLMQHGKITYTSCNVGDIVLVTWDQAHRNYMLLQDSPTFYFLNSDCIADLDLKLGVDGLPLKQHVIAEVVDKEYCSARKTENRYRVPQGTKFFRVRVKPLQRPIITAKH